MRSDTICDPIMCADWPPLVVSDMKIGPPPIFSL